MDQSACSKAEGCKFYGKAYNGKGGCVTVGGPNDPKASTFDFLLPSPLVMSHCDRKAATIAKTYPFLVAFFLSVLIDFGLFLLVIVWLTSLLEACFCSEGFCPLERFTSEGKKGDLTLLDWLQTPYSPFSCR